MRKVTANKNKNSQHMLRVKGFNTDFRYFFASGSDVSALFLEMVLCLLAKRILICAVEILCNQPYQRDCRNQGRIVCHYSF